MLRLYAAIGALLALLAAFAYVRHTGVVAAREKQFKADVEAYQKQAAKADSIARALEVELAKQRDAMDKLKEELQNETAKPIYRDCRVPADGVRLLRKATSGPR